MTDVQLALGHLKLIQEQLDRALEVCTDETVSESYKVGYSKGTMETVTDMLADVVNIVREIPYPFT